MQTNPQIELANNLLRYTNAHLFLTGKAGTGKTTFLHNLRLHSSKRMVVLAPTGVAAINAGGVTIHSFFQLSFAPFIPDAAPSGEFFRFSKEKMNIIRSMDLLVIDEISMVRADLLDAVDNVLRHFRKKDVPFGGVQLLMIGDLQQLAPVAKEDEWALLGRYYKSPFFYDSHALKQTDYLYVELKKVYRQSDETFIEILNCIRDNKIDADLLKKLNERYSPGFDSDGNEGYITLTTHNVQAQRINKEKLEKIKAPRHTFKAEVTGVFPEYAYPTDANLELKKGAQVMFVKNDPATEKRYFNGKIGIVSNIGDERIEVKCEGDESPIIVEKARWSNMKYMLDSETQELREEEEGAFEQYPLKTAWAITVHKSQGLTFEKAVIDANASFAHGQVYVALSRCKTLEGLVLRSPITFHSVINSKDVAGFISSAIEKEPDDKKYKELRDAYFSEMLFEQFSFSEMNFAFFRVLRMLDEHFWNLYPELLQEYKTTDDIIKKEIVQVSEQFKIQLQELLSTAGNPEDNSFLNERIKKAAIYFGNKIRTVLQLLTDKTNIETDNKENRKRFNNLLSSLQAEIRLKQKTLDACKDGFHVLAYLEQKSLAAIEEKEAVSKKKSKTQKIEESKDILHPELYEQLKNWRYKLAQEQGIPVFWVLSQAAILGVTNMLPVGAAQLSIIPGIGKAKISRYGEAVLEIVQRCVQTYGYELKEPVLNPADEPKKEKTNTKKQSFILFDSGKTIPEIAEERSLAESTIESHLLPYLKEGKIVIERLVEPVKIEHIQKILNANPPEATLTEIKNQLGDDYSWSEIRFVKAVSDFNSLI